MTTSGEKNKNSIGQVSLGDRNALLNKDGKGQFISLLRKQDELSFTKEPCHYIGSNNLKASLAKIKNYNIASDYRRAFLELNSVEIAYLSFIGRFASVLYPQIITEHRSFSDIFGPYQSRKTNHYLNHLCALGLIEKYRYFHPIIEQKINFYTLSGDGYRLLTYVYGPKLHLLHPNMFFKFKDGYHIRFWQIVDLYEAINEIPGLAKYNTYFAGTSQLKLPMSPLQFSLEIAHNSFRNYIVYSMLQTDRLDYYQRLLIDYFQFQAALSEQGNTNFLPDFPDGETILTFYVPTIATAKRMVSALGVALSRVKFQFIVSIQIKNAGFDHAFYQIEEDENGVKQLVNEPLLNIQNIAYYSEEQPNQEGDKLHESQA
ncbi:hypothetical protein [Lactiplantibacillus plantarum]|uniref:hypothetical protein n=1 Tax=Lactiplantibacillus plantarum TaxID=1590 RepID=UPI0020734E1F|nr:hypothetical protein [Lactiplantibacillus plantarum]